MTLRVGHKSAFFHYFTHPPNISTVNPGKFMISKSVLSICLFSTVYLTNLKYLNILMQISAVKMALNLALAITKADAGNNQSI